MSSIQRRLWEERAGLISEEIDSSELISEETLSLMEDNPFDTFSDITLYEMVESGLIDYLEEVMSKQAYVSAVISATDPDSEKNSHPDKIIARAKKQHGDKFAKDLELQKKYMKKQGVAEGVEQNPDQVRQTLNAWMNQDQQFKDPTQRAGFQAKVWPYIEQNINAILSDKGADGKGSYPAAPYAAWLLVQHMDAYPQNQGKFLQQLTQSGLNPTDGKDGVGKLQFLKDRYEVNKWILQNANNKEYWINGKPLPNPTVNVRNPAIFKDAGQVATSRDEALKNAIAAGNKLLVAAVQAPPAKLTQPSYKSNVAEGSEQINVISKD